jgi:[ribosomal protein S5]-alanine N-acetyltransferase
MSYLLPLALRQKTIEIRASAVCLRTPRPEDYWQWKNLREQSRAFLVPWEPIWNDGELTRLAYRLRLRHCQKSLADDTAYTFFVFDGGGEILLGGIVLSNVRRGVAQCGTLGYWIGEPFARQGHMTHAVLALRDYAFSTLDLHRLEAACLPANTASIRLLERCGFGREGFAKSYLKINGRWEDHILWSCGRAD